MGVPGRCPDGAGPVAACGTGSRARGRSAGTTPAGRAPAAPWRRRASLPARARAAGRAPRGSDVGTCEVLGRPRSRAPPRAAARGLRLPRALWREAQALDPVTAFVPAAGEGTRAAGRPRAPGACAVAPESRSACCALRCVRGRGRGRGRATATSASTATATATATATVQVRRPASSRAYRAFLLLTVLRTSPRTGRPGTSRARAGGNPAHTVRRERPGRLPWKNDVPARRVSTSVVAQVAGPRGRCPAPTIGLPRVPVADCSGCLLRVRSFMCRTVC